MDDTVVFHRALGGPTDRRQPEPMRLDWDDAGQEYPVSSYRSDARCQMKSHCDKGLKGALLYQSDNLDLRRVASGRFELPRPYGHRLLRPTRLPFRHEAYYLSVVSCSMRVPAPGLAGDGNRLLQLTTYN